MSLIRKHGAMLQAWACLALVKLTALSQFTFIYPFLYFAIDVGETL